MNAELFRHSIGEMLAPKLLPSDITPGTVFKRLELSRPTWLMASTCLEQCAQPTSFDGGETFNQFAPAARTRANWSGWCVFFVATRGAMIAGELLCALRAGEHYCF